MVTSTQVSWRGMSGQVYSYSVHPVDENWYDGPGNYIFAKPESTEGRPWGQPLKKLEGAPLNLG